jgi:hypothetical protein
LNGPRKGTVEMPKPPPEEQGVAIAEQLRTLAAELERHGRPEFVAALFERGRGEGLKALQETGNQFLRRVDRARETLRGIKHAAIAPYRAPVLKILKAIETAADVTFDRRPGGAPKDDGEWLLAQRVTLLPEHYRTLAADHGKTLNDLASEIEATMTEAPTGLPGRSGTSRRRG